MPEPNDCPGSADLERFLLGRGGSGEGPGIGDHVARCPRCLQALGALESSDPLVEALRRGGTEPYAADRAAVERLIQRLRGPVSAPVAETGSVVPAGPPRDERGTGSEESTDAPVDLPADVGPELFDFLAPPEQPDEIGRLGDYRVLRVLGSGGMGVVFQAEDPALERKVALKTLLPGLAVSAVARQRFLREARAAAAIEHDHIVPILHVGEERGIPFIAMPLLKGEPLNERLRRVPVLPTSEVIRIGKEAARALAAAHEHGLIHRDVKPANLFLEGEQSRVKILDFGLARAVTDKAQLTASGAIVGTPGYMAPEQAGGQPLDARSDLFSLGCVLYRLSTGRAPFSGTDVISTLVAAATEPPLSPCQLNPALPRALSDLVLRLLAKNPADRPGSAAAVAGELTAIERFLTNPQSPGDPAVAPRRSTVASRGRRRALAGLLAAVVLLAVAIGLGLRPRVGSVTESTVPGDTANEIQQIADPPAPPLNSGEASFAPAKTSNSPPKSNDASSAPVKSLGPLPRTFTNSLGMEFVLVPRGKFLMGSGGKSAKTEVEIASDFYLGKYEVTQEEWQKLTGVNPCFFRRGGKGNEAVQDIPDSELARFPVEMVSCTEAEHFADLLNAREQDNGWVYRLPRVAEWEYACRGGAVADPREYYFDFYLAIPTNRLPPDAANFSSETSLSRPCKVGSYKPNRLGLYDMHGNVWEWCEDSKRAVPDPNRRGLQGGSWKEKDSGCRAASRHMTRAAERSSDYGLRLARVRLERQEQQRNDPVSEVVPRSPNATSEK